MSWERGGVWELPEDDPELLGRGCWLFIGVVSTTRSNRVAPKFVPELRWEASRSCARRRRVAFSIQCRCANIASEVDCALRRTNQQRSCGELSPRFCVGNADAWTEIFPRLLLRASAVPAGASTPGGASPSLAFRRSDQELCARYRRCLSARVAAGYDRCRGGGARCKRPAIGGNTSRSRRSSSASDSDSRQIRAANTFQGVRSGATDAHLCGPTNKLHMCEPLRRPRPALHRLWLTMG
jgi:hypothetical protein